MGSNPTSSAVTKRATKSPVSSFLDTVTCQIYAARVTSVDDLLRDLLRWLHEESRPYDEVMEAWRTSCPRLPVWEEAGDFGFVRRYRGDDGVAMVTLTPAGVAFLSPAPATTN